MIVAKVKEETCYMIMAKAKEMDKTGSDTIP